MDLTICAWVFVIVFFCVYSAIQTRRCCKVFHKLKPTQTTADHATITSNGSSICNVEAISQQPNLLSNTPSTRRTMNPPVYHPRLDYLLFLKELGVDDSLPTYEEAMAYDSNKTKYVEPFQATKLVPGVYPVTVPETEQTTP